MNGMKNRRLPGALLALLVGVAAAFAVSDEAFQLNEEGLALLKKGRTAEAKEKFLAAVEAEPQFSEARVNAAKAAEVLAETDPKEWETVKVQYLTVLTYEEENVDALVGAGHYMIKVSNLAEAEKYLTKAIRLDPQNASAEYGLGNMYHKMKKYEKARPHYVRALKADARTYHRAYLRLGLYAFDAAKKTKKYDRAAAYFERYLGGETDAEGAFLAEYRLGLIYYQKKEDDKALAHLAEAKKLRPGDYRAYYYGAEIYNRSGKSDAAVRDYLACLERKPGFGEAHFKVAILLQKEYRDEEALDHYRAAAGDKSFSGRAQARQQVQALEEYFRKLREAEAGEG